MSLGAAGAGSLSSLYASTADLFTRNKHSFKKFRLTKNNKTGEIEERPIELSNQIPTLMKLSRKGSVQSVSSNIKTDRGSEASWAPLENKDFDNQESITMIPTIPTMNKRLAVAQQKYEEKGKITALKQARIDAMNKKFMALSFPAGFEVNTKAIKDKKDDIAGVKNFDFDFDNSSLINDSKKSKDKFRYQKAQECEEW